MIDMIIFLINNSWLDNLSKKFGCLKKEGFELYSISVDSLPFSSIISASLVSLLGLWIVILINFWFWNFQSDNHNEI